MEQKERADTEAVKGGGEFSSWIDKKKKNNDGGSAKKGEDVEDQLKQNQDRIHDWELRIVISKVDPVNSPCSSISAEEGWGLVYCPKTIYNDYGCTLAVCMSCKYEEGGVASVKGCPWLKLLENGDFGGKAGRKRCVLAFVDKQDRCENKCGEHTLEKNIIIGCCGATCRKA